MESLFNQMVKCVMGLGLLDGERTAALDGSKLPTPESYEGCGVLKQTHSVSQVRVLLGTPKAQEANSKRN